MSLTDKRILAIDDTPSIRTFLRISLQSHGAQYFEAATAAEGLIKCAEVSPEIVVLDLGLPDRDGMEILPEILKNANGSAPAVIILSVRKEQRTRDLAYELGASGYVTKPFIMEDLLDVIEEQLKS